MRKKLVGIAHPVYLRVGTTDLSVFKQVFVERHYDSPLPKPPKSIVDAGANIGLSAVYFANQYAGATIVAIEPEDSNFKLLKRNVSAYSQIFPLQAALWKEDGIIALIDSGEGHHGFQIIAKSTNDSQVKGSVISLTLNSLMEDRGWAFVHLLKIDIEGAEKEVFENCSAWIDRVGVIMAELHDNIRPGCSVAFNAAVHGFVEKSSKGEISVCIKSPSLPIGPIETTIA